MKRFHAKGLLARTTLLGDALHNMTPSGGIGANTALRDAVKSLFRAIDLMPTLRSAFLGR
jgi:2-polyprenyl-6-methoxyphenol hydroxylase-like FAD-dependent oxidoreductase